MAIVSSSPFVLKSFRASFASLFPNSTAKALPIPDPAPVMATILSLKFSMALLIL